MRSGAWKLLGLNGRCCRRFPEMREQFVDLAAGVGANADQHVAEILPGVEAMPFAGADQRIQNRRAMPALVTA